jgi:pantetheine-phosphate adenylyltransferase
MKKTIVYPGFFDPFTLGHQDIVLRATDVFDEVIVAVAKHSPKTSWFSFEDRFEMIKEIFNDKPNVIVDSFDGLLINYLQEKNQKVLLRGIRTVSDFEYEFQMSLANKTMDASVETFFMMTESQYSFLSSSLIREIARLGGDVSQMVPTVVFDFLKSRKVK